MVGADGHQAGVMSLQDALAMARTHGVDLVEVAPNATPPVCRLVDYGKYRYEQAKREKDAKKHQHANKVKEIQLSAKIDPHDMSVKLAHAVEFFCDEMKVKVSLRFRGREMAHTEVGFEQISKFTKEVAPWGHPDNQAKLVGRGITVMFSPLPRNKRAKNPNDGAAAGANSGHSRPNDVHRPTPSANAVSLVSALGGSGGGGGIEGNGDGSSSSDGDGDGSPAGGSQPPPRADGFQNNPFSGLDIAGRPPEDPGSSQS